MTIFVSEFSGNSVFANRITSDTAVEGLLPLFHFNLSDGTCAPDEDGTDLPDVQAAKIEAVKHAAELMRDDPREIWEDGALKIDVTDHAGHQLFSVTVNVADGGR